ncbi:hypothetical protein GGI15_002797 [Coemansia interrupta]|uniref:Branched-chain-amino-acid aminotransferase n=1 Tax=Coemansia interrupta TaxID=1126814 RepID=A0A9W8HBW2_9FUNG|nr:hypothetical protein GGI15_002797 [Coemansia interrupta]
MTTPRSFVVSLDLATRQTTSRASTQDARAFMLAGGPGAYTAMRTVDGGRRVFLLAEHMQRLAQSSALLLHGSQPAAHWLALVFPLLQQARRGLAAGPADLKLTVLVGPEHVHVQATRLTPPPASCRVRFAEGRRLAPEAKDLQWVHDRAGLERQLAASGLEEIVLVHDGRFYEGLSSNFFATRRVGEGRGPGAFELVTAPQGSVLLGTVMRLVLRICARDGIGVSEDARVGCGWSGAFVTSTSRGVLPVGEIVDGPQVAEDALVGHLRDSIQQTILCAGLIAHRTHAVHAQPQFTVLARTTDNKQTFPHRPFALAVHAAALQLWHNHGLPASPLCRLAFWAPRLRLLYARAHALFVEHGDAPLDDLWVEAHVCVAPFSLAVRVGALAGSAERTCRVLVCRGRRPPSLVARWHLSEDPCGMARMCVGAVSDVLLVDPESQRMGEGLLSWLFVLRRVRAQAGDAEYCVEAPRDAGLAGDRVVRAVLSACVRRNVRVRCQGARLEDALQGSWAAAFIAAEAFGLLPVDALYLTGRRRKAVAVPACPAAAVLQREVRDVLHSGDLV